MVDNWLTMDLQIDYWSGMLLAKVLALQLQLPCILILLAGPTVSWTKQVMALQPVTKGVSLSVV